MKLAILFSSLFTTLWLQAFSQITVTAATFPSAGDTLRFATDAQPSSSIAIGAAGGNQTWDFSALASTNKSQTVYQNASTGANASLFPAAELVSIAGAANAETYYNKTATRFETMGYVGPDPTGFGLNIKTAFNPAISERRAPLTYASFPNSETTSLSLAFSTALLPDTLFGGTSIPGDSIRIKIAYNRLDFVDAWGKMTIPGGTYDVLRERRFQTSNTTLEIHVAFLGWIAIPFNVPGTGLDTTITYNFFSNTEKEPIAVATMTNDESKIQRVQFKNNKTSALEPEIVLNASRATVQAYPNPAVEYTDLRCTNVPDGPYLLKLYNVIGDVVWQQKQTIVGGSKTIRIDLADFKRGTYLYSLTNAKGEILATKRLMIVKP